MDASLRIQVTVINRAQTQLKQIENGINGINRAAGAGKLDAYLTRLQYFGRQLTYAFTLPLGIAGGAAVKFALDNERAFTRIKKVYGDLNPTLQQTYKQELPQLRRAFEALSNVFGVQQAAVLDIAAAWAQAGASGIALARATRLTLETMILGDMDATQATQALIAIQAQYGLVTDDVNHSAETLTGTIAMLNMVENQTAADFPGLVQAFQRAGGSARSAGVDARHLAAMIASLVPAAGTAANAGNALKTIISRILAPTSEAADIFEKLGINLDSTGWQSKNATERLVVLAQKFEGLTGPQKAVVSATIASRFQISKFDVLMRDIINPLGYYQRALDSTADSTKNYAQYQRELGIFLRSSPQAFNILKTQLQNVVARVIIPLIPAILAFASAVVRVVDAFTAMSPVFQKVVLLGALFLFALGPILQYFANIGRLFIFMHAEFFKFAGTVGWAGRAIGGLATNFVTLLRLPFTLIVNAFEGIAGAAGLMDVAIMGIPVIWIAVFTAVIAAVIVFRRQIGDALHWIAENWQRLPGIVLGALKNLVRIISEAAKAAYEWLSYLNPFAHHSPSLVEQVTAGVALIAAKYASLSGIGQTFRQAIGDLQAFKDATANAAAAQEAANVAAMRKDVVKAAPGAGPAFDALAASLARLRPILAAVGVEVDKQQAVVNVWDARLDAANHRLDVAQDRLKVLRDEAEKAQKRVAEMNGELEMLNGEQIDLRLAGAGSDVLGPIGDQIAAVEKARDQLLNGPIAAVAAQEAVVAQLEQERDLIKERYDTELKALDDLKGAYSTIEDQINAMEDAMNQFAESSRKAKGQSTAAANFDMAGKGDFPDVGGGANIGREVGDINALADKWAKEASQMFGSFDIFKPMKEKFSQAIEWMKKHSQASLPALGALIGFWLFGPWGAALGAVVGATIANWDKIKKITARLFNGSGGLTSTIRGSLSALGEWIARSPFATVWDNLVSAFGRVKNTFQAVWSFIGDEIVRLGGLIWEFIVGLVQNVVAEMSKWSDLWKPLQEAFTHILNVLSFFAKLIAGVILVLVTVVLAIWKAAWPVLINVLKPIFDMIIGVVKAALQIIHGIIQVVLGIINGDWSLVWNGIKNIFGGIWNGIVAILKGVIGVMIGVFRGLGESAWNILVGAFNLLKDGLKSAWNGITDIFKDGVNFGIRAVNTLIHGLNKILSLIPGVNWKFGDIPEIGKGSDAGSGYGPRPMANGGMIPATQVGGGWITDGARAIVGEGSPSYPEYVVPTDPRYRDRAEALWLGLGRDLGMTNSYGIGGIIDPITDTVGDVASAVGDAAKKLVQGFRNAAVATAFAPINLAFDNALKLVPIPFARTMMKGMKDEMYTWLKGVPSAADGAYIQRRAGGTLLRVGEGRTDEAVLPLPRGARDLVGAGSSVKKEYHFHGDLSFPNVKSGEDAEDFLSNLESLAGD